MKDMNTGDVARTRLSSSFDEDDSETGRFVELVERPSSIPNAGVVCRSDVICRGSLP